MKTVVLLSTLYLTWFTTVTTCVQYSANYLNNSLVDADGVVTFDNLGWSGSFGWQYYGGVPLLIATENQIITIVGPTCRSYNSTAGYYDIRYDGSKYWMGSETEKPGFIMFADDGGLCNFTFGQPINAFVMRSSAFPANLNFLNVYDAEGNQLGSTDVTHVPGLNPYDYQGFSSDVPISHFVLHSSSSGAFYIDNIQWRFCGEGFSFDGSMCADVNECASEPCSLNAFCNNTEGSFSCSCKEGYSGDGFKCEDIDECLHNSTCSSFASCNNTEGSFVCECIAGYDGNGIGADGCQEVIKEEPNPTVPMANWVPTERTSVAHSVPVDVILALAILLLQ